MGDPAGIGLDVLLLAHNADALRNDLPAFILAGDPDVVAQRARQLGLQLTPRTVVPIMCAAPVVPGQPNAANAPASIAAIECATQLVRAGRASAVLTNPIAKHVLIAAGFKFPGHTEFLGALARQHWGLECQPVMMLAAPELKVVPVTVHVALAMVPRLLTTKLIIETARTTMAALRNDFGLSSPRLAVCGLNPHAGENGLMGSEDHAVIQPAINALRSEGYAVTGPHPADTLFHAAARSRYDAVLAMYHDQGLIPLKTLSFDAGVNITLGLPFVRSSPDHGTAFDIAGTGRASPASFVAALRMAADIAQRRAGMAT